MLDGPDCGVLILSFGRVEGFLGVCVGDSSFFWDAGFFLPFFGVYSLFCFGGLRGSEPWGLALDLVSMVEFVLGLQIHYDLVHYVFFLFVLWSRRMALHSL